MALKYQRLPCVPEVFSRAAGILDDGRLRAEARKKKTAPEKSLAPRVSRDPLELQTTNA